MTKSSLFDLTGEIAVVTGGNGGIGRGIALGLAQAGAGVAIVGRNLQKNQSVLEELQAAGARAVAVKLDLTDRAALQPAWERIERELGPVSILVNNAGNAVLSGGVLLETPGDWDSVIATQLNSVFLLSKIAATSMMARKRG